MIKSIRRSLSWHLICASLMAFSLQATFAHPVLADDDDDAQEYDHVREQVAAGALLPLSDIRKILAARVPGDIIDIEIEHEGDKIIYEIKILRDDGHRVETKINAKDGTILNIGND